MKGTEFRKTLVGVITISLSFAPGMTIYNAFLDYGTEGANPDNFELMVFGLHIPGDFTVKEVGNNVVVTLNDEYIDFNSVTLNDIYVIGKLIDIPIASEDNSVLCNDSIEATADNNELSFTKSIDSTKSTISLN